VKVKQSKAKENLTLAAFVGFQMGAAGDKNFSQYLESLGILKAMKAPPSKDLTKEQAIAKAEEILAMARKKRKVE